MSTYLPPKPNQSGPASTAAIAIARLGFLAAVRNVPQAGLLWAQLFERDIVELAARDFRRNPYSDPSPELEERIERWATACHLADPPVRDWWIFGVARHSLKYRACGPLTSGFPDEDENEGTGVPVEFGEFKPDVTYSFEGWDPAWTSIREYKNASRRAFGRFLDEHTEAVVLKAGDKTARNRRERKHYEWLVRYQVLGQSFQDIGETAGEIRDAGTVKDTVLKLRNFVGLPHRRSPGRPPK